MGIDDKFIYFKDFINNENCVGKKIINEMLIVYDITRCKFWLNEYSRTSGKGNIKIIWSSSS